MVQRLREIRVVGGGKVYGAKDGLDRRVAELKDALPSLAQLGRPTRQEQKLMDELMAAAENGAMNLTRAVRLELAMAEVPLSTVQIRDLLLKRRFSQRTR